MWQTGERAIHGFTHSDKMELLFLPIETLQEIARTTPDIQLMAASAQAIYEKSREDVFPESEHVIEDDTPVYHPRRQKPSSKQMQFLRQLGYHGRCETKEKAQTLITSILEAKKK